MFSVFPPADIGFVLTPFLLVSGALLLDALFGDLEGVFRRVPHPVVVMGQAIDGLDKAGNKPDFPPYLRRINGGAAVLGLVFAAAFIGVLVQAALVHVPGGWIIEICLITVVLAARSLYDHVAAVGQSLASGSGGIEGGRRAISALVSRNTHALDEAAIARAAIESLAENFGDAVVAPVFWYVLFGLPGLLAFKMISTLDSMIGYRTERYEAFGWAAARLDDLANFIPARLAAGLLLLTARFSRAFGACSALDGFRIMRRDHGRHRSPNGGWPESAMAGILGVRLGGPREYAGAETGDLPWMGDGREQAGQHDIDRALNLYVRACLWLTVLMFACGLALA